MELGNASPRLSNPEESRAPGDLPTKRTFFASLRICPPFGALGAWPLNLNFQPRDAPAATLSIACLFSRVDSLRIRPPPARMASIGAFFAVITKVMTLIKLTCKEKRIVSV